MNDWRILDLYFKDHKYPFTNHHLDSYRELIKRYIPQTIKTFNPITMIKLDEKKEKEIMKVNVYVGGRDSNELFIDHPITYENGNQRLITPNDARLKSITYETHIYANILIEIFDEEGDKIENTIKNVAIGSIPIMLHSDICVLNGNGNAVLQRLGECIYDGGGYFIIDGKEKVIIAQESETNNCLITGKLKDDDNFSYKGKIKSSGEIGESVLVPRTIEFYLVKNTGDAVGATAYLLKPQVAKALLDAAENIYEPVDHFLEHHQKHGLEFLAIRPYPVGITKAKSTIDDRDERAPIKGLRKRMRSIARIFDRIFSSKPWFPR